MRLMTGLALAATVVAGAAGGARAEGGNRGGGPTVDPGGGIEATVSSTDFVITSGGSGSGPRCTWTHLTTGAYENTLNTDVTIELEELPEVPELPTDREPTDEELEAHTRAQDDHDAVKRRNEQALAAERARRNAPAYATLTRNGTTADYRVFTASCPDRAYGVLFVPPTVPDTDLLSGVTANGA